MVRRQIQARGIVDPRVLEAMRRVPRERFVPESRLSQAFDDAPVPIGAGQTVSQPYIVAFMAEALRLAGDERVLEVGTGSGYQTAVLARLSQTVYTVEILSPLAERAVEALASLGIANVRMRMGDGYRGWPEEGPFDAILVSCAPDHIPAPLLAQLAQGGRMVVPIGGAGDQDLFRLTRDSPGGAVRSERLLPVSFVPLTGPFGRRFD